MPRLDWPTLKPRFLQPRIILRTFHFHKEGCVPVVSERHPWLSKSVNWFTITTSAGGVFKTTYCVYAFGDRPEQLKSLTTSKPGMPLPNGQGIVTAGVLNRHCFSSTSTPGRL
ncbi:hypothetical protein CPSG_08915 [Coccidioides posadasii str. Silveira]|uniref:Uncharacterized protein n=1 Tax=Coccidioides posadasii (strain RMSCC 757 / Silveira) TaxID=443226 RepID=E9DGG6_COCPS|nr:hypothetical protein CPSG_08915 [Coccidioides posadasii str. Silveira]